MPEKSVNANWKLVRCLQVILPFFVFAKLFIKPGNRNILFSITFLAIVSLNVQHFWSINWTMAQWAKRKMFNYYSEPTVTSIDVEVFFQRAGQKDRVER